MTNRPNLTEEEKEFEFDIFREIRQLRDAAEELEEVKLERDALWVKTQEDEREINQLRDVIDELKKQKSLWEEDALRYCKNADFWKDKYEHLVKVIAKNTLLKKLNSSI